MIVTPIVIDGQVLILRSLTGLGHLTAWLIGLAVAAPSAMPMGTRHEARS